MPVSKGFRRKSRKLLRKKGNEGFIRKLLENMNLKRGDSVVIKINPAFHRGMPHRRFHGKIGVVIGKRGRAFEIKVGKENKERKLIIRPEHLQPL